MDEQWEIPKLDIEKSSYTVHELLEWNDAQKLVLSPEFQRGTVWKTPAKAFLIDTILRGFPIPPIHIRFVHRPKGYMREVIDGQQRLTSVLEFVSGKFPLSRGQTSSHGNRPPWAGLRFDQLDPYFQERVLNYSFRCETYKGQMPDALIREIFARINIHSVPLSDQEIRNGRYFGEFKQAVYTLAQEYLPFWQMAGVFSAQQFARMIDAQFVSEVFSVHLGGIQDQKKAIARYYLEFDDSWPDRQVHEDRFRVTMDTIRDAFGDIIKTSKFSRLTLFYTLYTVVYHRRFGIEQQRSLVNLNNFPRSPAVPLLSNGAALRLRDTILMLSEHMSGSLGIQTDRHGYVRLFIEGASKHTDNIRPRLQRFIALWELANLSEP